MNANAKERIFTEMVRKQKSTITAVCMMFTDEKTPVDDLVQESLINLWQGFDGFEGRSDVRTWVWRVCLNTCISIDRKRKRRPQTTSIDDTCRDILSEDGGSRQDAQLKLLHDRIHQLGVFDRAIVMLWLEGMPYDEIGMIVGISAKNVSVRLVRIREQLKKMSNLNEEED